MNEGTAIARAHPSLALIKYWGKASKTANTPATPSLALDLEALVTETRVTCRRDGGGEDKVILEGKPLPPGRSLPFFNALRAVLAARGRKEASQYRFLAQTASNFPPAAGLASSASGFAALALAAAEAARVPLETSELSALARWGSASAARAVLGGFTLLEAGASFAQSLYPADWWPDLRVLIVQVTDQTKGVSSREAMERTRLSSPYYSAWVADAPRIAQKAQAALKERDLEALGPLMRLSCQRMFASMMAADPPLLYWQPESLKALQLCEALRKEGLSLWETMDAGPQVKVLCLEKELPQAVERFARALPQASLITSRVGSGPGIIEASPLLASTGEALGGRSS